MKKNGFTIVELVTVIILLGILSAVAIPRFFNQDTFTSFFDKSEFETTLAWVRNRAVTTQCAHELRLTNTGWLVLKDDDRDGNSADFDCDSRANAGNGCSAAANEFYSFVYTGAPNVVTNVVTDALGEPLIGDTITTTVAAPIQRLIFTANGQLYRLNALPANLAQGCTALPSAALVGNNTSLVLQQLSLTMDGSTAYVAIQ